MPEAHLVLKEGTFIAIFVMSIVLHEYAHGWMAAKCGDYTAQTLGRLTLNPLKHIDPVWSVIVPALVYVASGSRLIFGGAKPVPINPHNFRSPTKCSRLVSIAGVGTNFLIAIGLSLLLRLLLTTSIYSANSLGAVVLARGIIINLLLAFFNLIPIPPLDGSRLLETFLPDSVRASYNQMGRFGFLIIIVLLMTGMLWPMLGAAIELAYKYICFGPTEVLNAL